MQGSHQGQNCWNLPGIGVGRAPLQPAWQAAAWAAEGQQKPAAGPSEWGPWPQGLHPRTAPASPGQAAAAHQSPRRPTVSSPAPGSLPGSSLHPKQFPSHTFPLPQRLGCLLLVASECTGVLYSAMRKKDGSKFGSLTEMLQMRNAGNYAPPFCHTADKPGKPRSSKQSPFKAVNQARVDSTLLEMSKSCHTLRADVQPGNSTNKTPGFCCPLCSGGRCAPGGPRRLSGFPQLPGPALAAGAAAAALAAAVASRLARFLAWMASSR